MRNNRYITSLFDQVFIIIGMLQFTSIGKISESCFSENVMCVIVVFFVHVITDQIRFSFFLINNVLIFVSL